MLSIGFYWPLGHKVLVSIAWEKNVYYECCIWACGTVFSTKNLVEVGGYGVANERIYLGKNVRCITRSEHKQYFNESYVE